MECSHLEQSVDVSPHFVKKLTEENRRLWVCHECRSKKSPWMCLKCGLVLCGRYVNGHCKQHGETNTDHYVCIDTTLMVFCYKCDEFVINDTLSGSVQMIRAALETRNRHPKRRRRKSEEFFTNSNLKNGSSPSKENMFGSPPKKLRTVGLRNLGNTCFMNAILQSLSNLKHFSCYFKELPSIELNGKESETQIKKYRTRSYQSDDLSLVEELRKVLCALCQGASSAISPDALFNVVWKLVPRFRGYQQHDAHEFMHYLLDHVHTELLQTKMFSNGESTIVSGIFGGDLQSEVTCLKCGTISKKQEAYLDLSLDIPCKFQNRKTSQSTKNTAKNSSCHLEDCLQRFVEVEELDTSEWYICTKCKKRQPSTKKFWLLRLPNVLCLHLKRFRYSPHGRTKVDTFVRFPVSNLNMNPFLLKTNQRISAKGQLYDLAAVVVHHGSGAGSGHYTTYARNEGAWYNFNDSNVSKSNEETVTRSKAYILFYTRQYPDINVIENIKQNIKRAIQV